MTRVAVSKDSALLVCPPLGHLQFLQVAQMALEPIDSVLEPVQAVLEAIQTVFESIEAIFESVQTVFEPIHARIELGEIRHVRAMRFVNGFKKLLEGYFAHMPGSTAGSLQCCCGLVESGPSIPQGASMPQHDNGLPRRDNGDTSA
jgi:hypothetical protein